VRQSLNRLLDNTDDYVPQLHDILYDSAMHLAEFGLFCALELLGTIRPSRCPPVNGRIAKALRRVGITSKVSRTAHGKITLPSQAAFVSHAAPREGLFGLNMGQYR
jgi:hypothetical protein